MVVRGTRHPSHDRSGLCWYGVAKGGEYHEAVSVVVRARESVFLAQLVACNLVRFCMHSNFGRESTLWNCAGLEVFGCEHVTG